MRAAANGIAARASDICNPFDRDRDRVGAGPPGDFEPAALRGVGVVLIGLGLIPLVESFARFVWKGVGTPAPILPTRHLVVSGFYRYVRNPMYVGVTFIIVGQAVLFADPRLAIYAALIWFSFHLFVMGYEEPTLRRTFGAEYVDFCEHVPRWAPRWRAWEPDTAGPDQPSAG